MPNTPFVKHVMLAAALLSGASLVLCLVTLTVVLVFKLYQSSRDRLLVGIVVSTAVFSLAGVFSYSVYRSEPGFNTDSSRCFVYAFSDAANVAVVLFELFFAIELGLQMHRNNGISAWAQWAVTGVTVFLAVVNFVYLFVRCLQEGPVWHVNFNHVQSAEYWSFTALVVVNLLVCLAVGVQTAARFREWRQNLADAAVNGYDFANRRITLVDLEMQTAKEQLAPLFVLPVSFVVFSVVFIVDAVALQHDSPHWRKVGVVCFMITCLRGAVLFIAAFSHREMRARLNLPNLWARLKKRSRRSRRAVRVRATVSLAEPLLASEDTDIDNSHSARHPANAVRFAPDVDV